VVIYAIRNDLEFAISYGFIIPFFYGAVLLLAIPKAIRAAYKTSRNREEYVKGMTVFAGLSPWFALIILDYFHASHLLELLLANLGFIVITTMLLWKSIRRMRREHLARQDFRTTVFEEKCRFYKLTPKEMEIALFLAEGLTYKEIGERLFISDKTVDNYVQRIYEKVGVRNKMALINKLTK
jgi:DNA-binding CsgD family transcriptional regulator